MAEEEKEAVSQLQDRPVCVELKDQQILVRTFNISMSRKHRWLMTLDLMLIGLISGMFTYNAVAVAETGFQKLAWGASAVFLTIFAIVKTITDFSNWYYEMNTMLNQVGQWYIEDMRDIVSDMLSAGIKFAEAEVKKATDKSETGVKEEKVVSAETQKD